MIIHDVEQGSPEWFAVRAGLPTASSFDKIITAGGDRSKQSSDYMDMLIAEFITKENCATFKGTRDTERGKELEPEAVESYELTFNTTLRKVGFITNDAATMGCSPDRLEGEEKGVEFKVPAGGTMIYYARTGKLADEYRVQVQGSMLVTGLRQWHIRAWHPKMSHIDIEVERDTGFIMKMSQLINEFNEEKQRRIVGLRAKGWME